MHIALKLTLGLQNLCSFFRFALFDGEISKLRVNSDYRQFEAISHFCQQNLRLQMEMCFRIDFAHCTRPVDVIKLLFLQQMMQPAVHRSWELLNERDKFKSYQL